MNVIIIGTGNVATVLGKKIKQAGHTILQIYGRTPAHAEKLAIELSSAYCTDPGEINLTADLYLAAISDKALYDLACWLNTGDKIIAHTAGSVPAEVLKNCSSNYGVLYPLQSLRAELDPLTEVPLLTEGNNASVKTTLLNFARSISANVAEANGNKRMKLHVAAVMASNFTNHLYAMAENYCEKEDLDFGLLYPLIEETASRLRSFSPSELQTGPAVRHDEVTITRHLQLLDNYPAFREIYILLTKSIREKDNFAVPETGPDTTQ